MVTASAGSGLWNRLRNDDISRYVVGRGRGAAVDDIPRNVAWDELFWRAVSDTSRQFGGDHLGVAVEGRNGQRPGDAPEPPMGQQADDSKEWRRAGLPRAAGEMRRGRGGDGDRLGGVFLTSSDIGVAGAADWVEIG